MTTPCHCSRCCGLHSRRGSGRPPRRSCLRWVSKAGQVRPRRRHTGGGDGREKRQGSWETEHREFQKWEWRTERGSHQQMVKGRRSFVRIILKVTGNQRTLKGGAVLIRGHMVSLDVILTTMGSQWSSVCRQRITLGAVWRTACKFLKDPQGPPEVALRTVEWKCASVPRVLQFSKLVSQTTQSHEPPSHIYVCLYSPWGYINPGHISSLLFF